MCADKVFTMTELKHFNLTEIIASLQAIQNNTLCETWTPKKFYLDKVPNKKQGYVFYVRYLENGVVIPSHWTTKTNDYETAERYAIENRERLLTRYFSRGIVKKPYCEMFVILRKYYELNSSYLQADALRGRKLGEKNRIKYNNFIKNYFINFLKKNSIYNFEEINAPLLSKFRKQLLAGSEKKKPIKPQTIKSYFSCISQIYDNLITEGVAKLNPVKSLVRIKMAEEKLRGCYEITMLKGAFNKKWGNQLSYLLCLIIYTTGMRNGEIERIKVCDLIVIDKIHFINIQESKTRNGIRIVPLHEFVYRKIITYAKKNDKNKNDLIFENVKRISYEVANSELARFTKYSKERLEAENITFYSGRHFWKTLMDSENLGDIEEYFMGHKTSGNVAKRYNHKDRQGKKKLIERTKRVFAILDKWVFR